MANIDQTGLQNPDANAALEDRRFDDFGVPLRAPDVLVLEPSSLHPSHVTNAKLYLLTGDPQKAINTLARVPLPPTEQIHGADTLHTIMCAWHLLAEASLELGGSDQLRRAVDYSRAGLELAATSELAGKEPLYFAALYVTHAESIRRCYGSIDPETTDGLLDLLSQTASQEDIRYRAIEYVGYRAHALSLRKRHPLKGHYLDLADQARKAFLANVPSTPRQEARNAKDDQDKLREPKVSPLLSALILFPFPSQGQSSLPIANHAFRRRY